MGGRVGKTRKSAGVEQVAQRLQSAIGTEYAAIVSELSELLSICDLQLSRGETKTVQAELKRLNRTLATSAKDFRSWGE